MFVGEASAVVWVALALIIGFVGFFVMVVALFVRLARFVARGLFGTREVDDTPRADARRRICPHPRCGHLNPRASVYCARCGRPLRRPEEIDAYG